MGRTDGSGRTVSPDGADDTGAGILHADMDAFFAAVEVLDEPRLRGLPVIVGGRDGRAVVSSATYQARRFGVRSAMPVGQALRLCPQAIVVPPHFERYREVSTAVMAIFRDLTPLVEPLSIDEAFLDVTGARRLLGSPGEVARLLRRRVREELRLSCSVGAAATKHVAKMASTLAKPDGLLIVPEADTQRFLDPRPVSAVWGIGPKAAAALEGMGIHRIADIRATPDAVLERVLGQAGGARVRALARGVDARDVETSRIEKSVGHEETFTTDVADRAVLSGELLRLSDRVAARLRAGSVVAAAVSIKVRLADFTTMTRTRSLPEATDVGQRIAQSARELLAELELRLPVRLIGVRAERLAPSGGGSATLWDDDAEWRRLDGTLDHATTRFGDGAVTRAAFLRRGSHLPEAPRPPQ